MAILRDLGCGRGITRENNSPVCGGEAVAKSGDCPVSDWKCSDCNVRILEDNAWLDLMYIHFPSGLVRVLQTFNSGVAVYFVSIENAIYHLLGSRRAIEFQRFLPAHDPGRNDQVGQTKRVIRMEMGKECDPETIWA